MTQIDHPLLRMRPNKSPQRIRFGFPWVFQDELVLDRRSRAIPAGSIVALHDNAKNFLGLCAFNAASKITCRMLDRAPDAVIDAAWIEAKLARALDLRERLFDRPFYRLIHAEADGLPGVIIDRFGDVAVVQPNAAWADERIDLFRAALENICAIKTVVINGTGRARAMEGLDEVTRVLAGQVDAPLDVPMNGAIYKADLLGGQKTGLFFDQRPNHAFAARLSTGARMLDVFSHVGGFSLAALAAGATSALAVDGSAAALELARQGARASGCEQRFATRKGDAFDIMQDLTAEKEQFDLVVCDPPAFAPNKPALEAGLRAYERVARLGAGLVASNGYLVLCSCSHAADLAKFREACLRGIGKGGRRAQILHSGAAGPDHPTHPNLAESGYLKSIFLRLD